MLEPGPTTGLVHSISNRNWPACRAQGAHAVQVARANTSGGPEKDSIFSQVDGIELKGRDSKIEVIKADKMAGELEAEGKVALYGLYFDTAKATIKPTSKPTLDELGKLLKNNPKLKILEVGHTDNQGGFDFNINLSKQRAASVVKALTSNYSIAANRLKPWGVGYAAPAASNSDEAGRAKNRRVVIFLTTESDIQSIIYPTIPQ